MTNKPADKKQWEQNPVVPDFEWVEDAMHSDDSLGWCIACGSEAYGVEPDAERYCCEECGEHAVFGAGDMVLCELFVGGSCFVPEPEAAVQPQLKKPPLQPAVDYQLFVSPDCIHRCAREHGWWPKGKRNIPEALALVHSEVSEALEAFRAGDQRNFAEELADICIRVFDLAAGCGVELAEEIQLKHLRNLERPFRHGGKKA